jgi:hypothetical protein
MVPVVASSWKRHWYERSVNGGSVQEWPITRRPGHFFGRQRFSWSFSFVPFVRNHTRRFAGTYLRKPNLLLPYQITV